MFRYCAAYYLWQWTEDGDRSLWEEIGKRGTFQQAALERLFKKYRVIRNIRGGCDNLSPLRSILNDVCSQDFNRTSVARIVDEVVKEARMTYKSDLTSAVSKALWMMKRHPVAIYDSRARRGLNRMGLLRSSNIGYGHYYDAWMELFCRSDTQQQLRDCCAWLPTSPYAQSLERGRMLAADEINSNWFKNRLFDMRLFFLGEPGRRYRVGKHELHAVLGPGLWP